MNKKSFLRIICKRAYIAPIVLSLVSCSVDELKESTLSPDGYIPVNIQLDNGYAPSDTRSTLSSDAGITFEEGDSLGLFVYAGENGACVQSNLKWIYTREGWQPEDPGQRVKYRNNTLTIRAWYPYGITALPEIATDQMTVIYYEKYMQVLAGETVQAEIGKGPVSLALKHPYALLKLSLPKQDSNPASVVKLEVSDEGNKKIYYSFHRVTANEWTLLYPAEACNGTLYITLSDGTLYQKNDFSSTLTANQIYTYTLTLSQE